MRRHTAAVGVAFLLTAPLSAQTDSVASWPIGSRVRVWTTPSGNMVGTLREVRGDTLVIGDTMTLASSALRLEVSGRRFVSLQNVAIGAFAGGAFALGARAVLQDEINEVCPDVCGELTYGRAALIGAAVGAIIGAAILEDHWRERRLPGRLSLVPATRHTAIALSFAFR